MKDRALNRYMDKMAGIESGEEEIISKIENATDIPENRIRAVVEAMDGESDDADGSTIPLSQSPSTDASPRPSRPRRLGVNDISYLSDREFARVLGLTLEQFDGNTVRPLANETVEVNLLWNRQHRTIGIRTVSSTDEVVGETHITSLLKGNTTSEVTRAPSSLAVVTNGTFNDKAEQMAEDNDIYLFDGGHLERWFRRALIPFDAVGTVLEQGENHDGPLDELVTLPTPPEPRCGVNPLELESLSEMQTGMVDEESEITREELLKRVRSLHDRLDRLPKATDVRDIPGVDEEDYLQIFGSWDEALEAAGLDKERALLDEIRRVAEELGETPSYLDIGKYGKYSRATYRDYFGSWSSAVEQSGVEESDDSSSDNGNFSSDNNDREAMLKIIGELHERVEHIPKTTELPEECEYSTHDFYREFGSWDEALKAAGIDKEQALLNEIERVAEETGRVPSTTDMQERGPGYNYSSYFGTWDEALEAAGLDKERALQDDIERVAEELGRAPNYADMAEYGNYSGATYTNYFGSWSSAVEQLGVEESDDSGSDNPGQKSSPLGNGAEGTENTESCNEDEILDEIEKVQRIVHREPTRGDFKTNANIPISAVDEQFNSWKAAVNAATASDTEDGTSSGDSATLHPNTAIDELEDRVAGVGSTSIHAVKKAGYNTLGELHDAKPEEITECKGIGRAKALKVIQFVTENVSAPQEEISVPANDEQSSPGEKGVLYADPDEDGDYQMFDDYLEEL